jgi:hypothetical protein
MLIANSSAMLGPVDADEIRAWLDTRPHIAATGPVGPIDGRLANVCGSCGELSLSDEVRACSICGGIKPVGWVARDQAFPLEPHEAMLVTVGAAFVGRKGRPDLASAWLDEIAPGLPPRRRR